MLLKWIKFGEMHDWR